MNIELWDVAGHLKKLKQEQTLDPDVNMYNCQRTITCQAPPTALAIVNGMIVVGESSGRIELFKASLQSTSGGHLLEFLDHKGEVTDIYAVRKHIIIGNYPLKNN